MKKSLVAFPMLALALVAAPLASQETAAVEDTELTSALQDHHADADADRAVVDRVLSSDAVRGVAQSLGVDVERARTAARVLEGDRLDDATRLARAIEDDPLAGGQNITFNATTLIIILLLVVLVVLIAE